MLVGSSWANQWEYWQYFDGEVDDHLVMFDGPTKTIWILEGVEEVPVKESLYSDWKEWIRLYDNSKYLQAFQTEGGRPISDTERLGDSYLLINDWVIRQRDASTPVNIVGNLYAYDLNDEPKDPYTTDPNGGRSINSTVSNLVNIVSPAVDVIVDYDALAGAVWNSLKADYLANGTMGQQMSNIPNVQEIVDGVLDEPISSHLGVGSVGEKINEIGTIDYTQVEDAVWNAQISDHTAGGTFGKKLRNIAEDTIWVGDAGDVLSSTVNTITVANGVAQFDNAYDPATLYITEGTGAGQTRNILQYNWNDVDEEGTFVLDRNLKVQPDATSVLVVVADAGREHVNEGLAQGGSINTITLNPNASDDDNAYNGQIVFIRSGTGEDQARRVGSYNGTTKIASLTRDWAHVPDTTSAYVMLPTGALSYQCIQDAVYDVDASLYNNIGTRGEQFSLTNEEARRARAMATNKVDITRVGSGAGQVDTIVVYDDDGVTELYRITVTGEDADNREVIYTKPY